MPLAVGLGPVGAGAGLIVALLLGTTDLYRRRLTLSVLDEAPALAARAVLASVPLQAPMLMLGVSPSHVVAVPLTACAGLASVRLVAYARTRNRRSRGQDATPALLVGAGVELDTVADRLVAQPALGTSTVSRLPLVELQGSLGPTEVVTAALHRTRAGVVIVGSGVPATVVSELRACPMVRSALFVVSPPGTSALFDGRADRAGGVALRAVSPAAPNRPTWVFKRALDVLVAAAAIIATAPALAAAALAVRVSSTGPAIFRQVRLGRRDQPFEMLKFRTLPVDHVDGPVNSPESAYRSGVGRFLRRSSLDELPQLVNVLRGEMSVVGPRPERPHVARRLAVAIPGYELRTRLPTGCTGWAQVHGLRGDTSLTERVELDNHYIDQWCLWRDVVILLRTPLAVGHAFLSARRRRIAGARVGRGA